MQSLPSKQTATTSSGTLEYVLAGSGSPAIILINGAGGPIEGWHRVFSQLESLSTVLAFNRLGIGKSDKPKSPQTGEAVVATLHELLSVVDISPPYLLVGHSLGGLYANLFARRFADEVAGVVFLESAAVDDEVLKDKYQTTPQRLINGVLGLFDKLRPIDPNAEVEHVPQTMTQIQRANPFPDIPVTVITGGKRPPRFFMSDEAFQIRQDNQKTLVDLSPQGKQVIATNSTHFPQFSEPELVVQEIKEMVESRRT